MSTAALIERVEKLIELEEDGLEMDTFEYCDLHRAVLKALKEQLEQAETAA